jgi:hypothetical protein
VPYDCKQSRQGGIFFRASEITGHFQYTSSLAFNQFGDDAIFQEFLILSSIGSLWISSGVSISG